MRESVSNTKKIISFKVASKLYEFEAPLIMGIVNITSDSFYAASRVNEAESLLHRVGQMQSEGVNIVDIGGQSSRPGAITVSAQEELDRVLPTIALVRAHFPNLLISVDTFYATVAKQSVQAGAHIINDISAGDADPLMFDTIADLKVPYCIMHKKGDPLTMQDNPDYEDVFSEVVQTLATKIQSLRKIGLHDVWVDPGFGFGKTISHNYSLLLKLEAFKQTLGCPVLVGISRKSMIWKPLGITPEAALPATSALHMVALQQGAQILRVHDVAEANQVIKLWQLCQSSQP